MLALTLGHSPGLHPVVGSIEQRLIVVVDVFVVDKGTQQLVRFQRALGLCGHVMGVLVEIGVDEIDGLVLCIVVSLALFRG